MKLVIRSETFYRKPGSWLWQLVTVKYGVVVESETGSTLYSAIHSPSTYPLFYDWTVREADGSIVAHIREDAEKRRAGTKKWLGFIEYRSPKPEFIVDNDDRAELARVRTIRDPGRRWSCLGYRMRLGNLEYQLEQAKSAWWPPYNNRWLVRCGIDRVAESDKLGWKGATMQRMQFSVAEDHVWPVLLLILTAWGRERSLRDGPIVP